jgi:hypothetical protein
MALNTPYIARTNCIRQLEFALLQMIKQVDELLRAIQSVLQVTYTLLRNSFICRENQRKTLRAKLIFKKSSRPERP